MPKEIVSVNDEIVGLEKAYKAMGYAAATAKIKAENAVSVSRMKVTDLTALLRK